MSSIARILQVIGLVSVASGTIKVISLLRLYIGSSKSLDRYKRGDGSYALITGASDGIGLGFAENLATRGFNIILLARNKTALETRKSSILQKHPNIKVEILVVDAFSTTLEEDLSRAISSISHLNVTILINNMGGLPITYPHYRLFSDYTPELLAKVFTLNNHFLTSITRLMIPLLAQNGPSLMLNISSGAQAGLPRLVPYSASKGFVHSFSHGLHREFRSEGIPIDVLNILTLEVNTKSNDLPVSSNNPLAHDYTAATLDRIAGAVAVGDPEIVPWVAHGFGVGVLNSLPEFLKRSMLYNAIVERKRLDEQQQKEGKFD